MDEKSIVVDILPGRTIFIKAIESSGIVDHVKIDSGNVLIFNVTYWMNGEQKFCSLLREEFSTNG